MKYQYLVEHPDGRGVGVEAVVRLARLRQLLRVPAHEVLLSWQMKWCILDKIFQDK